MGAQFDIVGFDSSYKVPVVAVQIDYASGPQVGEGALDVLLVGLMETAGNLTPDVETRQVFTPSDVSTAAGLTSQLGRMGLAAFKAVPQGANVFLAAVSEPVGSAATVTLLFSGTWTVAGQFGYAIAGKNRTLGIQANDTIDTFGAALAAQINGTGASADYDPFIASYNSGSHTLTLTCTNKGAQGKRHIVVQDVSGAPAGFASAITGSSTIRTRNGVTMVYAGASATGTGVEDVTTLLTNITRNRWARIGSGQIDATNAAEWKAFVRQQLAPLVQIYEMAVFGNNDTQSVAVALAQTTLDDFNCQVFAMRNSETHPAEISAGWATLRAATEGDDPVPDYDQATNGLGQDCSAWIAPNRFSDDSWLATEQNVLLNSGVTPIATVDGAAKCIRAITTYCLLNGGQDERCLDIGDAVFPAYAAIALENLYRTEFRTANKYVQDNPDPREPPPKSGIGYPDLWTARVKKQLTEWGPSGTGWLRDTFSGPNPKYPVQSAFNNAAERIQGQVPMVVARVQHALGITIVQVGPS